MTLTKLSPEEENQLVKLIQSKDSKEFGEFIENYLNALENGASLKGWKRNAVERACVYWELMSLENPVETGLLRNVKRYLYEEGVRG